MAMIEYDLDYIKRLIEKKKIDGPVLELGAGYGGDTCGELIRGTDMEYFTSDMHASQDVDYVVDFGCENIEAFFDISTKFKSILILNVLEHTLEPLRILDNARKLLDKDGSLIIIAPTSWPLHNFPIDCYRFLPNFFEQYAVSRKMYLDRDCFEYIDHGLVDTYRIVDGTHRLPLPGQGISYLKSKVIHRVFNTVGRGMITPSCLSIGAVFSMIESQNE
jgi:SAM-dependent methyltransferase